jgi:ribosomal protein S21
MLNFWPMVPTVNVEVVKGPNENNISVLRRFSKRVQGSGVLPKVRSKRYTDRVKSENVRKAKTLTRIKRREEIQELIKLGKMNEVSKFGRRRRR